MLCVDKYPREYVSKCWDHILEDVNAYEKLVETIGVEKNEPVVLEFEKAFFNKMLLALEGSFVNRSRAVEGKDGNVLNEVRLLSNSLMENSGVFMSDKLIKLDSKKSVLGYEAGDAIGLTKADFIKIAESFIEAINQKYTL